MVGKYHTLGSRLKMSEDHSMMKDLQESNKLLRKQNEIMKAALDSIYERVRGDQTLKTQIQKLITLEDVQKLASRALFEIKDVK